MWSLQVYVGLSCERVLQSTNSCVFVSFNPPAPPTFRCNAASAFTSPLHSFLSPPQTPEFRLSTVLISSPVTLVVCMWGMTSRRAMQLLKLRKQTELPPPNADVPESVSLETVKMNSRDSDNST